MNNNGNSHLYHEVTSVTSPSVILTWHGRWHGSALDAGADRSSPLAGKSLNSNVISGVRLQTLDDHLCFCCTVGVAALAVNIPIHHLILDNPPIPLCQRRGVPGQIGGGGSQTYHPQINRIAGGNVFRGGDLLQMFLSIASWVSGAQCKNVCGSLVEARDCEVIICVFEVFDGKSLLICPLVLQLVSHMLPDHVFRGLPLDQGCVPYGGAYHHSGLTGHWKTGNISFSELMNQ